MKKDEIIYLLQEKDIQEVALQELERKLSEEEIQKIVPLIEVKIDWYDIIACSINEVIEIKND